MKLLITGATGFIGSYLTKRLLKQNVKVWAIVRKSTNTRKLDPKIKTFVFDHDIKSLIDFLNQQKFDGVIHLASLFLSTHRSEDVFNLIESNVLFPSLLLEACVESQTPWFINTGTFTQHYKNKKYSPVNLYSATKQAFEDIAQYYIEASEINFVTIKLFDTFGPHDTRSKIFALWSKIANSRESLDMSPGDQIIDINYVDNIVDGYITMVKLLSSKKARQYKGKSFALSSGERMSLKKLAQVFEQVSKKKLNINWGKRPYKAKEVMVPWTTGESIPGWKPKISLKKGIQLILKK